MTTEIVATKSVHASIMAFCWFAKQNLPQKIEGEKGSNARMLEAYSEVLLERINADKKLNVQIGE